MTDAAPFKLLGGAPCLNFANTVDWRKGEPRELLNSVHDLIDWARQVGTLTESEAQNLHREADMNPEKAEALYLRAIRLRETMYRVFRAAAGGASPGEGDLEALNSELHDAQSHMSLTREGSGFNLRFNAAPEKILWDITYSAMQVLTSDELSRVKECSDPRCGWLFLDTSRNSSRRWCSMEDCGNRNKARKHYRKRKAS